MNKAFTVDRKIKKRLEGSHVFPLLASRGGRCYISGRKNEGLLYKDGIFMYDYEHGGNKVSVKIPVNTLKRISYDEKSKLIVFEGKIITLSGGVEKVINEFRVYDYFVSSLYSFLVQIGIY